MVQGPAPPVTYIQVSSLLFWSQPLEIATAPGPEHPGPIHGSAVDTPPLNLTMLSTPGGISPLAG